MVQILSFLLNTFFHIHNRAFQDIYQSFFITFFDTFWCHMVFHSIIWPIHFQMGKIILKNAPHIVQSVLGVLEFSCEGESRPVILPFGFISY